jgi:hypothetical protein
MEEKFVEEKQASDSPWLQQNYESLADLSEICKRLVCDLDSLAENFGERMFERGVSNHAADPSRRVRTRMLIGMTRQPIGLAAGETHKLIEHQIDKHDLDQVLTRIAAQLREMTAITQKLQQVVEGVPDVIQTFAEATPAELQIATNSITSELKPDYGTYPEVSEAHSQYDSRVKSEVEHAQGYEAEYEEEPNSESEPNERHGFEYNEDSPEPDHESQYHVTASGYRSHDKTRWASSAPCSDSELTTSMESVERFGSILCTSSMESNCEQCFEAELEQSRLERFQISRTTMPHYRRSPISQEVGTDQSFSSDL